MQSQASQLYSFETSQAKSLTCPCSNSSTEGVLVMRSDGSLLRLKKGVHAREIMETHAGYKLVRCSSDDRRVMMGSVELESNRLYFLVPEGSEGCRETYEKFWRVGESKGSVPQKRAREGNDRVMVSDQALLPEAFEVKKSPWRPALKTIEEITLPSLGDHAKESFPAVRVN